MSAGSCTNCKLIMCNTGKINIKTFYKLILFNMQNTASMKNKTKIKPPTLPTIINHFIKMIKIAETTEEKEKA